MVTRRVSECTCFASLELMLSVNLAPFSVDWIFTVFTSKMQEAGHEPVFRLLGGRFWGFSPRIDGGEMSCPIVQGLGGAWAPKTINFTKFWNMVSLAWFLQNFQLLWAVHRWVSHLNFRRFGVPDLHGLTSGGAFPPSYQHLLAAKLYVGCENVFKVQEWYGAPLSPFQVWWGPGFACRRGG